tara:strand:- start:169 stop:294 length:126 start_codon:yes stop_codon:yes gene_type:complete
LAAVPVAAEVAIVAVRQMAVVLAVAEHLRGLVSVLMPYRPH